MRTLPVRLPAVVLVILSAAVAAALAGSPASSHADELGTTWVEIETPPEVLAAAAHQPKRPAMQLPLQGEVTVVAEGFDAEEFPPPGWLYGISGVTDTPEFQWSRETCDIDNRIAGNVAAAWSVGGGTGGDALACGAPYTQPVLAFLLTGPYDARGLAGGVELEWRSHHNIPANRGNQFPFGICILLPGGNSQCSIPQDAEVPGWSRYRSDPFLDVAGLEEVSFYLLYRDATPTGQDTGAFVDELKVIGLTSPEPTATQAPRTSVPPPPPGKELNLPITWRSASKGNLPDVTPAAPGAAVAFGTNLYGTDQGTHALDARLINSGSVFQYGQRRLCTRVTWWGQSPGTFLRWEWFLDGERIPDESGANPTFQVDTRQGSAGNCLIQTDGSPMTRGTWEVRAWLGTVRQAVGTALIQDNPPPGATAVPTAYPTIAASPTPVETPTDGCRNTIVNGDMERGSSVAWRLGASHTIPGRTIADVIRTDVTRNGGLWAAQLGGIIVPGARFAEELRQDSSPTGLVDPARMTSATLKFASGMVTNETRNGTDDDLFLRRS